MTDRKRGRKTKYRLPQNWRRTAAALLILFVMLGCICSRYVSFVSQTVYQESTSHLSELNPTICWVIWSAATGRCCICGTIV